MKHFFIVLLALVATALILPGVAVAQPEDATNESASPDGAPADCTERINEYTAICDAELDGSDVVIDIYTEGPQTLGVTEGFRRGSGELNQRSVSLDEGVNTIRMSVTVDGGSEGVVLLAGDTLYQKEVRTESSFIAGPFTAQDAQASGLGGALGVALTTLYLVARRVYGNNEEPERIA